LPPKTRALLDNWMGVQLFREGKWIEATEQLAMGATVAEALGEHATQVGSMLMLAAALWCSDRKSEAAMVQKEVMDICEKAQDHFHLTVALANELEFMTIEGRLAEAQVVAERAYTLAATHGFDTLEMWSRRSLIWLHLRHGETAQALQHGKAVYEQCQRRYGKQMPATFCVVYAFAAAIAGDRERAESLLSSASVREAKLEPASRVVVDALHLYLGQAIGTDWDTLARDTKAVEVLSVADILWLKARTQTRDGAVEQAKVTYRDAIEVASERDGQYAALLRRELEALSPSL
jgi:hypothetical protein